MPKNSVMFTIHIPPPRDSYDHSSTAYTSYSVNPYLDLQYCFLYKHIDPLYWWML